MKNQLAFASLLAVTSCLVAPAALAQTTGGGSPQASSPPPAAQTPPEQAPDQDVEISAPGAGGDDVGEIVVVGRNIPNVVRSTPQVVSVLSAEDIARTGEGDIAGALQRVTGLSVVGNGFVYVRGLGDRYSLSLLNGLPLPSPEPLRRVVPLDIFPTSVIGSGLVQKTFSANYPGEFGGGVINLTTTAVPKESFFSIGASAGFDTETTSELGYTYDGGSHDWLGFDSGERKVPNFILDAGNNRTNIPTGQVTQLTNAETTVLFENYHIPPNFSGEMSLGGATDVGGARLGIIASGGISNSWRTRDTVSGVRSIPSTEFRRVVTDHRALVNGLLGFGAEFGEHRIRFTNLYIHDTLKQGRLGAGTGENYESPINGNAPIMVQNTNWFERQLFTSQGVGEFDFGDLDVDVRGAYANTKRKSPYEREFRYLYDTSINDYRNTLNGGTYATIAFSELNEDLWSGGIDLAYDLNLGRPFKIEAGYAYQDTDRTSYRYTFDYILPGGAALADPYSQLRPDYLLSDANIQLNGIILRPSTTTQGARAYDAELTVHAGYGQVEGEIADGMRVTAGVRYETADQTVLPTDGQALTTLSNDYWLPAATLTWNFAPDMQWRLNASKTIARPQFRELAPQLYLDYDSDRVFYGNPFLQDSKLTNLEARYEWFFGRDQRFTAAAFYKKIDNPIETVSFQVAGSNNTQINFANAPEAELYGAEVEVQKYVPLSFIDSDLFATRRMVLIANYTYTQSEVFAGNQLIRDPINPGTVQRPANELFVSGQPLVGQSDHLVNLQVGFEDTERLSQLTFLFNYASDRIVARGLLSSGGLPPIVERPGVRFDFVLRQGFQVLGGDWELKFEGRNLTKTRFVEFQDYGGTTGIADTNTYDLGRTFSLGLSTRF
ncbi:TonB-dependent receptor domain-containing protein [Sphingomonas xinjiangensis]|uniref:Outer membrane receptor protein involved in Fe transport n=1 Tax=Sphingomonas xinjiangensis TaxID=643568 RepID=A0A840YLQ5_9SPHN|nr:TonB-dependent receptor [Sphingomonas xinjiangensis]MBB5710456.1 outer membrane receptor protein involved in Fe transport [Sphingomonas xinjiangensis]